MVRAPRLRRVVLTVHIIGSVGWMGAAAAYLEVGRATGEETVTVSQPFPVTLSPADLVD